MSSSDLKSPASAYGNSFFSFSRSESKDINDSPPCEVDSPPCENSIFGFMKKKVSELEKSLEGSVDVTTQEYKFPEIIIVGDEKNGKSSLLENITKCHIFPTNRSYCTKRPIRFISKNDTHRKFIVHDTSSSELTKEFTSDEAVFKHLLAVFESMGKDTLSENEIVIEYFAPGNHNFQFVDLPGIKANPPNLAEETKQITNKYLAEKNNIIMLAHSATTPSSANCSTVSLIKAHDRVHDTIMVLTMMDKLSDIDDVQHAKDNAIKDMHKTFYVISNNKPAFDEAKWFRDNEITEDVGVKKLLSYTEELFMQYVKDNWHKNIINNLENQRTILRSENDKFGTTDPNHLLFYKVFLNQIYNKTVSMPETLFEKPLVEYFAKKTVKHSITYGEIKDGKPVLSLKNWDTIQIDTNCNDNILLEQVCSGIVNKAMELITKHSKALLMDDYGYDGGNVGDNVCDHNCDYCYDIKKYNHDSAHICECHDKPADDNNHKNYCKCLNNNDENQFSTCQALKYADFRCKDSCMGGSRTVYKMQQLKNFSESLDCYLNKVKQHLETVLTNICTNPTTLDRLAFLKAYITHHDEDSLLPQLFAQQTATAKFLRQFVDGQIKFQVGARSCDHSFAVSPINLQLQACCEIDQFIANQTVLTTALQQLIDNQATLSTHFGCFSDLNVQSLDTSCSNSATLYKFHQNVLNNGLQQLIDNQFTLRKYFIQKEHANLVPFLPQQMENPTSTMDQFNNMIKGSYQAFLRQFTGFGFDLSSNEVLVENFTIQTKRRDCLGKITSIDSKIEAIKAIKSPK